jgi:hypothetical protein
MTRKLFSLFSPIITAAIEVGRDVLEASIPFCQFLKEFLFVVFFFIGGNQRDLARDKAAKKAADLQKSKSAAEKEGNKGLSLEARKQRCVLITHTKFLC